MPSDRLEQSVSALCAGGRIDIAAMLSELHEPAECPQVYDRLINDRNFPMAVQFDWTKEV